jgi:translation initiation factor IF-2
VQRRFLQSSRPVSKPPAEAAALREDSDDIIPQPAWGRLSSQKSNGFGPTAATWGRPGFGNADGGTSQAGPAGGWGRSTPSGNGAMVEQARQVDRESYAAGGGDLLPHEQRARDLMLEKQMRAQQRPVYRKFGPGPDTSRAGRYEPRRRSDSERLEIATRAVARRHARELDIDNGQHRENVVRGVTGPRISRPGLRHVMGDREEADPARMESRDDDAPIPRWGQLRRREEVITEEDQKPKDNGFAEARAQREEQSKMGKYTPLASRSILGSREEQRYPYLRRAENQSASAMERFDTSSNGSRGGYATQYSQRDRYPAFSEQSSKSNRDTRGNMVPRSDASGRDLKSRRLETPSTQNPTGDKQRPDDLDSRPVRGEKQKKSRSRYEPESVSQHTSYDTAPRGKGKDKAKRRQRFDYGEEADEEREAALARAELKKQRKREKAAKKAAAPTPILLPEYISVSNLAVALKVRLEDFVAKMEELGFEETSHDYILNSENAGLIAMEYNFEPIIDRGESEDLKAREPTKDVTILPQRPPVVTIMGHVDHGKTTLLDWLRKSSVAATEHGGITQHIGAFSVSMPGGKIITFLDTPGHAAFLSMRQRGANVTDIVILVVAADDSVKPQTIEAINHAKAAKVPIIVAINKIDKEDSNIDRVKQDLARHGVDIEDFGGDTQVVCVSGKTGQGMGELEEAAVTLSEILDMRAETDGQAEGWILEASIKSMGKVATVLVRRGTMRPGDFIVAGKTWARIRCLRNEAGVEIDEAGPGTPVEIDGWRDQPLAGDEVLQAPDEGKAKSVVEYRLENQERNKMAEDMEAINEHRKAGQQKREREKLEALAEKDADRDVEGLTPATKASGPKEVFFVIKGDVSGSVEAVIDSIAALGNKEVQPHILRSGVGQLSEFDIEHAAAAKGHVINFNTVVEPNISRLAEESKVSIIDHNIIYRLVDDVKVELSKHLPPLVTQRVLGEAEIAQIFEITVKGRQQKNIAGCKVRNGTISKTARVRVMRGGEKVFDGMF